MEDKRDTRRLRKRLSLRFGIDNAARLAFTEDLSATGIFIKSTNICPPGSKIIVEFAPYDTDLVKLECRVIWAKKVPPQLIHIVKKSGMGVRILQALAGKDVYQQFCQELAEIR